MMIVAVATAAACGSTDPAGDGTLTILLTDADGEVEQAVVKIERIELVGGPGGPLLLDDSGWMGDLTDLRNDIVTLVGETVVPQGNYSQLRVIVSEACIGVDTGEAPDDVYVSSDAASVECDGNEVGDLGMPSLPQTGIKVIFQGPIEVTGDQKILLLDFDVAQSFGKQAGGSGRWVMDPTIHGVVLEFSSSVNLTVELADGVTLPDPPTFEDFTASLGGDGQALSAGGTASWLFVVPDDYELDLVPPAGFTMTTTPTVPFNVTVEPSGAEDVTITIDSFQTE
jgi:hypothetical protein